ncbi:MAG: hypothetical protein IJU98_03445 [Synergistaceae bacterium]|nr:hypothetical protein [Synergistaceae bacterium]
MKNLLRSALVLALALLPACTWAASFSEAENALRSMTLEQKIGQLFIIRPDALDVALALDEVNDSEAAGVKKLTPAMRETLRRYPAGGFALFRKNISGPNQLKRFTADLRAACAPSPILAIDEEGGKIARIANHKSFNVPKFESMEAIGRTENPRRAREVGATIGKYLREYGFNLDFAPVADVNTNPENLVIGNRAFGSEPERVSEMVGAYLDGLHAGGVAGSVKHFPGHGDTRDDPHEDAVTSPKTWDELLRAELIPFRENLDKADSVMVAHITLPNVAGDNQPATLSREIVTEKLRGELGYDGVVITDALMMGAIKKRYSSAEAAVLAFEAGNDILLMPWDYREAFDGILQAVRSGRITEARLDESVRRILRLKAGSTAK